MGDVLSQKEIDELLKSMSGGGVVEAVEEKPMREARSYDFKRPSKFSKDNLRALEVVFDNFARQMQTFVTGYLRSSTSIEVAGADLITFAEFTGILVNPVILGILDFKPLRGNVMIELSSSLGYSIIERVLGGNGIQTTKLIRDFSELEKVLLERFVNQLMAFLPEAWENVAPVNPVLDKLETNAQFANIVAPNEMCALVTLNVKIGASEGLMNFCIPFLTVSSIIDGMNTRNWFGGIKDEQKEATQNQEIEHKIEHARLPVIIRLGRTQISVADFIDLRKGDVISLDSYVNADLRVYIGENLKFLAKPGISRNKNAVQITSLVESEG
jgi:flagellar motor switch protein FliM